MPFGHSAVPYANLPLFSEQLLSIRGEKAINGILGKIPKKTASNFIKKFVHVIFYFFHIPKLYLDSMHDVWTTLIRFQICSCLFLEVIYAQIRFRLLLFLPSLVKNAKEGGGKCQRRNAVPSRL